MAKTKRVANVATPKQVGKVLKANITSIRAADYLQEQIEDVIKTYESFLTDLLELTPRPTKPVLVQAVDYAYDSQQLTVSEVEAWSSRMIACITFCAGKAQSTSTGKKLDKHVWNVVRVLKSVRSCLPDKAKREKPKTTSPQGSPQRPGRRLVIPVPDTPEQPASKKPKVHLFLFVRICLFEISCFILFGIYVFCKVKASDNCNLAGLEQRTNEQGRSVCQHGAKPSCSKIGNFTYRF